MAARVSPRAAHAIIHVSSCPFKGIPHAQGCGCWPSSCPHALRSQSLPHPRALHAAHRLKRSRIFFNRRGVALQACTPVVAAALATFTAQ